MEYDVSDAPRDRRDRRVVSQKIVSRLWLSVCRTLFKIACEFDTNTQYERHTGGIISGKISLLLALPGVDDIFYARYCNRRFGNIGCENTFSSVWSRRGEHFHLLRWR